MSAHPLTMVDKVIRKEKPAPAASAIRRSRNGVVDWDGLRDVLPILVGLAPFAVVIGVAMSQLQIPHALGVIASGLVYAGSAQLAAMNLIGNGADVVTILVTVAVINARLLMYGAALEPRFRDQSRLFRWLAPHFIVDQTYALVFGRPELAHDPTRFLRYWLTVAGAITAVWLGVISLSLFAGAGMSAESPLMIAAPAIFIGMLVPKLAHRQSLVAAATAAIVSSAGAALPNGLGLLTGIVVGMAAGTMVDGRRQS